MYRPAPRLLISATFVVWASDTDRGGLTLGEKVVWYHTWIMDRGGPDACYMSDRSMAARLGLKDRTVQQLRYRLRKLGLLRSFSRDEGTNEGWVAILPAACMPSSPRATGKEAEVLAHLLDRHLCELDPGRANTVANRATAIANEATTIARNGHPDATALPGKGGRGDGLPTSAVQDVSPTPASPQGGEVGEGTQRERQGAPGPAPRHGPHKSVKEEDVHSEPNELGEPLLGAGSAAWQAAKAAVRPPWKDRAAGASPST